MARAKKAKSTTKVELNVIPRTIVGKKVKKLRREGFIPATIYGPDFKSRSIQVKIQDFLKTYKAAHETAIVFLNYDSEEVPVLIRNLQRHPLDDHVLHVDFRKVDLKQKIQTKVPVKIIGQSEAVTQKAGVLLTHAEELNIEALPENIPSSIDVDISKMKDIGQEIKVADLAKSEKYEMKESGDKVIITIVAHKEESVTPETSAPVTEVTTEKKPEEVEKEEEAKAKSSKEEQVKKETPKA